MLKRKDTEFPIRTLELTHTYGNTVAVDKISFEVKSGTIFGLIGPNGAGKSTTIKMLTTLLPVTSGQAYINGYSIIDDPEKVRGSIGYVPQLLSADGDLTGYENLLLAAKLYGLPSSCRKPRIEEVLKFMDIEDFKNQPVNSYSGGMIRRLEIAQSLIHKPPVLFLDEPTVGLDPAAKKNVWEHIQKLKTETGMTLLMTTHDMDEADHLCDRIAFVHRGRIIVMDTPRNLKKALGASATLDDVFIFHTGSSLQQSEDFLHVKETRATISHL